MEPPTVREVIQRLEREGWCHVSTKGDHRKYGRDGSSVTVSGKLGDHVRKGTYASIKRQAGW